MLGDLRTVPLAPRSVDIVHCCLLLDRISQAEIVLGRLVDALRPGGLLLLRAADRNSAAGFLDRVLPRPAAHAGLAQPAARRARPVPRRLRGADLGPRHPGVRDPARPGDRRPRGDAARWPAGGGRSWPRLARLVADGDPAAGCTAAHDELGYVIRKPEDRFARVL